MANILLTTMINNSSLDDLKEMKSYLDAQIVSLEQEQAAQRKESNKPIISQLKKKLNQLSKEYHAFAGSTTVEFDLQLTLKVEVKTDELEDYIDYIDYIDEQYIDDHGINVTDLFYVTFTPTVTQNSNTETTFIHDALGSVFSDEFSTSQGIKIIAPALFNKLEVFTTKVHDFVEDAQKHDVNLFDLTEIHHINNTDDED